MFSRLFIYAFSPVFAASGISCLLRNNLKARRLLWALGPTVFISIFHFPLMRSSKSGGCSQAVPVPLPQPQERWMQGMPEGPPLPWQCSPFPGSCPGTWRWLPRRIPWKEGKSGAVGGKGEACSEEGEMGNVNTFPSIEGLVGPGAAACTEAH